MKRLGWGILVFVFLISFVPVNVLAQDEIISNQGCFMPLIQDDFPLGNWELSNFSNATEGQNVWKTAGGTNYEYMGRYPLVDWSSEFYSVRSVLDVRTDADLTIRHFQMYLETAEGAYIEMFDHPLSTGEMKNHQWQVVSSSTVIGKPKYLVIRSWGGTDSFVIDQIGILICPVNLVFVPMVFDLN